MNTDGFTNFLIILFAITIIGSFLVYALPLKYKTLVNSFFVLITSVVSSYVAINVIINGTIEYIISDVGFLGNIPLRIDMLSAWFILIINFVTLMAAIYGIEYIKTFNPNKNSISLHLICFLLFHLSVLLVCVVQHFIAFLIVWEIMSLSTFILIIFKQTPKTIKAGINYLIQMHIGVAILTIAFIFVYFSEKSMDFLAIKNYFTHHSNLWLFLLIFIGFGFKSAFMSFHTWSPYVQTHAPAHISAIMSVKIGLFAIIKISMFVQQDYLILGEILLSFSLLAGLFGIINATVHRNYMSLLAYSSVENVGIIGMGIGLAMFGLYYQNNWIILLGFGSSILHTINHSLFKSLLFLSVGSVRQQTNTRNMEKLGGLIKNMPQTAIIFLIGALAIGGLPPFNGFVSEFILYSGLFSAINNANFYHAALFIASIAGIALIGGISIHAFTKSFGVIFLGTPRTQLVDNPKESDRYMLFAQYITIGAMISIAILPIFYFKNIGLIVTQYFPYTESAVTSLPNIANPISAIGIYGFMFFVLASVFIFVRFYIIKRNKAVNNSTWGCGYVAPKPNIQYTGKSFSKPFGKILSFLVFEKKNYNEIETNDVFPEKRTHSANYTDFFEFRFIDNIVNRLNFFMNRFQFVQNGSLQQYILYGLLFIILIFLESIFKIL